MKCKYHLWLLALLIIVMPCTAQSPLSRYDTVKAGRFDNGKMWTFDFPPIDYFEKTYSFRPTQQWLDDVRMSALRFAGYCSASFVSADGLVMTNHHCARESGVAVQKPEEDFNKTGFIAATFEEERQVPGLYVDQLVKIEDISDRIQKAMEKGKSDQEKLQLRSQEFDAIKKEYREKEAWKGLELQTITLYWGGKYSLYGFKRYNDVRLVIMPEQALGFFGGDYDNFTYPRYCLDFTFFRVYDESGKPLKTTHYFKFNPAGAAEGEAVFVVGNPGSTSRQATVSILEYNRDLSWPTVIERLKARSAILKEYNEEVESDSIENEIFSYDNSIKAISGMLGGLQDTYIMARRGAFEKNFKAAVAKESKLKPQLTLWDDISKTQGEMRKIYYDFALLSPNGFNSEAFDLGNVFYLYATSKTPAKKEQMKQFITDFRKPASMELEKKFLAQHFAEVFNYLGPDDPYVRMIKGVKSKDITALEHPKKVDTSDPLKLAGEVLKNTKVYDEKFRLELLEKGDQAILESNDPLLMLARVYGERYNAAAEKQKQISASLSNLRSKLGLLLFQVYGTEVPPDATFSLRISDGVVKGYDYNGTVAPPKTTFFGLYDRYYSFDQRNPWDLPEKWKNPPMELLDEPVNFVSTNDIIGGNSGSPMINKNKEVVGLIFDGNMESLPGNYIFLPERNRTVSVHAGGITAALKYIYKADRIVTELLGH